LNAILIFYEVMNSSGKDENTDADLKLKVSYQHQMPMIAPISVKPKSIYPPLIKVYKSKLLVQILPLVAEEVIVSQENAASLKRGWDKIS